MLRACICRCAQLTLTSPSYDARGEYNCVFSILHINHQSRFIYKYDRMFFWQARTRNMSVYMCMCCVRTWPASPFGLGISEKCIGMETGHMNYSERKLHVRTSSNISIWHCVIKNEESKWSKGLWGYLMERAPYDW